jgi:Na+-translocating ferredoxin:NAD+ oxidoreductase subunit C
VSTSTFKRGIHPREYKDFTCHLPLERMGFVPEYVLPLGQHIGAPAKPIVRKGQKVVRGESIATPGGYVSVAYHTPVTGTVSALEMRDHPCGQPQASIVIKTDPFSSQLLSSSPTVDWRAISEKEFSGKVQEAGIVGLGGAAFPTHVKLSIPEGKDCQYLILNGCECEPFLTADHRVMLEEFEALLEGTEILLRFLGATQAYIGVEMNKPDAISVLSEAVQKRSLPITVVPLEVKYPQGAEKMLISAILDQEVPSGKLPLDLHVVVANVSTTVAIAEFFNSGKPLIERVVTVTGPGVERPANLVVPIGSPIRSVLEACGGLKEGVSRIILGGPMMGMVQKNLDVPVTKGTSGILALTDHEIREIETFSCVRCGKCVEACPAFLNPSLMGLMAKKGMYEEMQAENLLDCMECASCSYVCPSAIPLVQNFRMAKSYLKEKKVKS